MRLPYLHEDTQDPETLKLTGRTAIARKSLSVPAKWLEEQGALGGRVLDFGCGRGGDVERLLEMDYDIEGYDPVHGPPMPDGPFDTIMCNYVLNVVDPDTEAEILRVISGLLSPDGVAYLAVRQDVAHHGVEGSQTGAGTFQRDVHLDDLIPVDAPASKFRMYMLGGDLDWDQEG